MRRLLALLFVLTFPIASRAQLRDENLLVAVPKGFEKGYENGNARSSIMEFVPTGQTVEHWDEMLTVQIVRGNAIGSIPAFRARANALYASACEGATSTGIREGTENGYAFAFWLDDCPLNKKSGTPERAFIKAIAGNDSLYIVQRAYRSALTKEQATGASTYLSGIRVCDTRKPEHPCPAAMMNATPAPAPAPMPQ
jgi:hypothetical protein